MRPGADVLSLKGLYDVLSIHVLEIDKVVVVRDDQVLPIKPGLDRLERLLQLHQAPRGCVVAVAESIHHKGAVVGHVSEIPSVSVILLAIRIFLPESMVRPLPDEPAL